MAREDGSKVKKWEAELETEGVISFKEFKMNESGGNRAGA